ncbi:LysR substrate-binding domain-containing protein [Shewanella chilikensis]|uniref:LysR family transcriptional regulator n=1 Tax=Shewanella chilikensis TaxID=558541 RepID=UPI0039994E76
MSDIVRLSRINFRHLLVLRQLLEEQSVNQAATRLCLSPSAVSKILSQLRDCLDDELFYRQGNQLLPTAKAKRLGPVISAMLREMDNLFTEEGFRPERFQGRMNLALRESSFELLASAIARVQQQAPGMTLAVHAKESTGFQSLCEGRVDLLVLPHDLGQPPTGRNELIWERLAEDEMCCLMRASHPLAAKELTLDAYLSFSHVGILDADLQQPFFEQSLAQLSRRRVLAMEVADFGAAASICRHTDLLFTCSALWASMAAQASGMVVKPLPFAYGKVGYSMVHHQSGSRDPALQWLKATLLSGFKQSISLG